MKEEDILLKKLGKENSFKVPDGYFENLTSEVMNKLPEKEKVVFKEEPVSTWTRLKPLLYMAAMFVGSVPGDRLRKLARCPGTGRRQGEKRQGRYRTQPELREARGLV